MVDNGADVVVVGGGIVGAATALRLAHSGRRIAHLDAPEPVGAATTASGAMLGVLGETTPNDGPGDLDLRLSAWRQYPSWLEKVGRQLAGQGTFVVAGPRRPGDVAALQAMEDTARRHGLRAERIGSGEIRDLVTAPDFAPVSALHLPDEAWVDAPALLGAVIDAERRSGRVVFTMGRVKAVLHAGGRVTGVRTAEGETIACDEVILCTGAAVPSLISASGLDSGLVPRIIAAKGVGIILETASEGPRQHVLRTPNRQFACGLHIVPRGGNRVYVGATNRAGDRLPGAMGGATAGEVGRLLTEAVRELSAPLAEWDLHRAVYGMRPLPMDGLPIVGRTEFAGLSVATGTYRNGVLLAPLMAEAVWAELDGRPSPAPIDISPRRSSAPVDVELVLRRGLAELVEQLHNQDNPTWYHRLGPLLEKLAIMAVGTGPHADARRQQATAFLLNHGRSELVPEAVIEILYGPDRTEDGGGAPSD